MTLYDSDLNFLERIQQQQQDIKSLPVECITERVIRSYKITALSSLRQLYNENNGSALNMETVQNLLADLWNKSKGTCVCYFALPNDDLTRLLVDILVSTAVLESNKDNLLAILLPGVELESAHEDFPNLIVSVNGDDCTVLADKLIHFFQTYILSQSTNYLIPVSIILHLDNPYQPKSLVNHYFNYEQHNASEAFITLDEYQRLATHTVDTKEFTQALEYCVSIEKTDQSFLGHVMRLYRSLYINSVNGTGQENNAGLEVYSAIINFNDYYKSLDDEIKNKIPEELQCELNYLFELSTNAKLNHDATEVIETCLNVRRLKLKTLIDRYNTQLSDISSTLSDELGHKAEQQLIFCRQRLKQKTTPGLDNLGLSLELLQLLQVKFELDTKQSCYELMSLKPQEIQSLLNNQPRQRQFLDNFETLECFVLFLHTLTLPSFEQLISIMWEPIFQRFVKRPNHAAALLVSFNSERFIFLCKHIKPLLIPLVQRWCRMPASILPLLDSSQRLDFLAIIPAWELNLDEFVAVVADASCDFSAVIQTFIPYPPTFNPMAAEFIRAIETCAEFKQEDALKFITNASFTNLLNNSAERKIFFERVSTDTLLLIWNALNVTTMQHLYKKSLCNRIFLKFDNKQRMPAIEGQKKRLSIFIKTFEDYCTISGTLKLKHRPTLYQLCSDFLPRLITSTNLITLKKHISDKEYTRLHNKLAIQAEVEFRSMPSDLAEFIDTLQRLPARNKYNYLNESKTVLCCFIRTAQELLNILNQIDRETADSLLVLLSKYSKQLNFNSDQLFLLIPTITKLFNDSNLFLKSTVEQILTSNSALDQLGRMLKWDNRCYLAISDFIKPFIPSLIRDKLTLVTLLKNTPKDRRIDICASFHKAIPGLEQFIHTPQDLIEINAYLESPYQQKQFQHIFFKNFLNSLPDNDKHSSVYYTLKEELLDAANAYYNKLGSPQLFQQRCNVALKKANDALPHLTKLESFTYALLAIITLGLIPLVSATVNKVNVGEFKSTFFYSDPQKELWKETALITRLCVI